MAHLLRGKQAGISHDLSAGLTPDVFALVEVANFGVDSQISCLAYDPVQSLLAVGTNSSRFGAGQIYIFGQKRVQVTLPLPSSGASAKTLQFCADRLICLDSRNDLSVYSLELKKLLASHSPPGVANVVCSDPMLDYVLLGMQTGDILAYDLDRESMTPFRIPNLWRDVDPRARVANVVSLQFHPRDIGTLLIGYPQGAAIFSFKLNKALRTFQYEIPRGALGGDGDPSIANVARRPRLTQAIWHPTGTFIMTGHEDTSLVFWDTIKDGRMLMARTITDTNVAKPGASTFDMGMPTVVKEPLFRVAWCANQDPEDTAIFIAGGQSTQAPTKGLTLFEMGRTPIYATSSWEGLISYLESPKRQKILPTPPGAEVVDFCLIPRLTPHFAGAHDPIAVIALLASGELLTMSFPSGIPISPTNQLHISACLVHPFVRKLGVAQIDRDRWLGMTERREQGPPILRGGVEAIRPMRRFESRNIVQASHADGIIRLWDAGHGDEIENDRVLQVDVARAVGQFESVDITTTSLAGASSELAVGLRGGQVVVFRWGTNRNSGRDSLGSRGNQAGSLPDIKDRAEPSLSEGFMPVTLLDQQNGPVTVVKVSEIGFVAAGFDSGSIAVIDMRGPAVIYSASVKDLDQGHSRIGSIRRRNSTAEAKPEWAISMEFSIMMLGEDGYSSIALHVGTNLGRLATFKVVPDPSGRYTVQFAGSVSLESKVLSIHPINSDTGVIASASRQAMGNLGTGIKIDGVIVAVTSTSIHVFRPPTSKGAHKSFDSVFCDAAGTVRYQDQGYALVGLFGDGNARVYALPSLREINRVKISDILDVRRFGEAVITPSGNIIGLGGPSKLAVVSIFVNGEPVTHNQDQIFNPAALIPPRPTISTVQWVAGVQHITPADMDVLIGGPGRPPSKRMIMQARAEEQQLREAGRSSTAAAATANTDETYWAYMQRQIQERTQNLSMLGEGVSNLEENSANWAADVSKFVNRQKRNAATGIIKAKFGF